MPQLELPGLSDAAADKRVELAEGALILGAFALQEAEQLLNILRVILKNAPLRQMMTPGGRLMRVCLSNCGSVGWTSDRNGYRYSALDPVSGKKWPPLPNAFFDLATKAAAQCGYESFEPDSCLINRYRAHDRLTLHQDKNERDYSQPIVSVSLGLGATFLFGGDERSGQTQRHYLAHGDVVVWGGVSRLVYHGVAPLADGEHALTGACRINLTFRRAR